MIYIIKHKKNNVHKYDIKMNKLVVMTKHNGADVLCHGTGHKAVTLKGYNIVNTMILKRVIIEEGVGCGGGVQ